MARSLEAEYVPQPKNRWYADWVEKEMPDLTGKVAIVTGANSGTGFWCAMALAKKGAQVVLACRSLEKADAARYEITELHRYACVHCMKLDNMDLKSVKSFAQNFRCKYSRLDFLINNAGIMAQPELISVDGHDVQWQTNHLAHFLLTDLLFDMLVSTGAGEGEPTRIVSHASSAHYIGHAKFNKDKMRVPDTGCMCCWFWTVVAPLMGHPKEPWKRYMMSKLCNVLFGLELQRRIEKAGLADKVESVMCHPGWASTQLQKYAGDAGSFDNWVNQNSKFAQSAADGALPLLMAATSTQVKGGSYCGPRAFDEMKGPPRLTSFGGYAKNRGMATELWSYSEKCLGKPFNVKA